MSDSWNEGYVSDIEYTHGYYKELAPANLVFTSLLKGVDLDLDRMANPRYLELGFGQGVSMAIHAAAQPGEYWGTDFNPAQTSHCQALMKAANVNARVLDDGFTQLAQRTDLPSFDIIVLHGIWSWVNDDNRAAIIDVVAKHLAPGGLVYCSYNASPGWDAGKPLRDLMAQHRALMGDSNAGMTDQIDTAVKFAQSVAAVDMGFFKQNPSTVNRLDSIAGHDRHYLAHEYFNQDWKISSCTEVRAAYAAAKLDYVGQSNPIDDDDSLQLNAAATEIMKQTRNPVMQEVLRDYFTNRQFRRDIFVKGKHQLNAMERRDRLSQLKFALLKPVDQVPLKLKAGAGEVSLKVDIYTPLLHCLASKEYSAKSIADVLNVAELKNIGFNGVIQALGLLVGAGHVQPVFAVLSGKAKQQCEAFNLHVLNRIQFNEKLTYLASPVLGAGVNMSSVQLQCLKAYKAGHVTVKAMAEEVLRVHEAIGRRVVVDKKAVETKEQHLVELEKIALAFVEQRLPVLKALKVL